MPKSISVVIATYNYGRFLGDALGAALCQTRPPEEAFVIDDGSTDDTVAVVQKFGDRVNYLRQENSGVSAARNRGVAESTGELIAFLDADDTWEPTKLEKQVAMFVAEPELGLIHCGIREFDSDTGETITTRRLGSEGEVAQALLLWEEPGVNVSGSCLLISRKAFEAVGGFDTRMKCGEDWDLCYRIARKYKVGFVPEPLVNYRIHAAAAHKNVDNMEHGMAMFLEKAFATDDPEVLKLKRTAIGNYHRVMAGSYFQSGRIGKFASHSLKSIVNKPANLGYFLKYPLRRFT